MAAPRTGLRRFHPPLCAILLTVSSAGRAAAQSPVLMRFPTTSATAIAFVARGTLWTAPLAGGTARRLAGDADGVQAARFSPDGRWIAYTGRHRGGYDVFVVPAGGGPARRLTFDAPSLPSENLVVAWTPDSHRIVFLSKRASPVYRIDQAFSVPLEGGLARRLPLNRSGLLSYGPGGRVVAFNRFLRNFELRKRYLGGQAQKIDTYDFDSRKLTRITDWKGTDTAPMWFGRRIYFLSDRGPGFRANIWVHDAGSRAARQVTHFTDYDIDWPSLGDHTISFQQAGRLWAIDLPSETLREVAVSVPDDGARIAPRTMAVGAFARTRDATGGIDYALSPDGLSLLLSAHGDIFRVQPDGHADDLTATPGIDEDHPSWSPDGRTIAYETETVTATGPEQQLAVRPAGGGPERLLTHVPAGYRYDGVWSPSGDALAVADANHALWLVPIAGGGPELVARDPYAEIRDAAFSPDGRWLAYSTMRPNRQRAIHLRALGSGRDLVVSTPMNSDRDPAFSADSRRLLFVSQRNELPFVSDRDDESIIATLNSDGLYEAGLYGAGDVADPAGLMSRAVALPVVPAVIDRIEVRGARVFYQTLPPQLVNGDLPGASAALHVLDPGDGDHVLATGLSDYSLSADGSRVAFRSGGAWHLASTAPNAAAATTLDLAGLRAEVDPRLEWAEMFEKAWRLDRDIFFAAAMNGDDWRAVHDVYARLLPRLGSDDDFTYLLGQMQGELASSHTFIEAGRGSDPRPPVATPKLGADFALDPGSQRYRFAHVYAGDNTRPEFRSPLAQPGLDLHEGDLLLAVDGHALQAPADPDSALAGLHGRLTLTVAATAGGPTRTVTVDPVDSDMPLRRLEMIERNRRRVDRLSGGRLGYVFLSDFDQLGSQEFVRQFYPQLDRPGLVIDVRWNRGGFTSQAVLDVLRRAQAGIFVNREGAVTPLPASTAPPVLVTLMNYGSASDGDQFPFFFRRFGLGPLVGTRTWGGVQGINAPWQLMDGTAMTIPKDALAGLDRHWVIENAGVAPDIEVDDRPDEILTGADAQLEAAVRVALDRLAHTTTRPLQAPPPRPAYPAAGNVPGASFGSASGR